MEVVSVLPMPYLATVQELQVMEVPGLLQGVEVVLKVLLWDQWECQFPVPAVVRGV